jgi:hypothetical protein
MAILKNGHVQLQTAGACGCPSCATSGPTTPRRAAGLTAKEIAELAREEHRFRNEGIEPPSMIDQLQADARSKAGNTPDDIARDQRMTDFFKTDSNF